MGLYDTLYFKKKCPNCHKITNHEGQTKQLHCNLEVIKFSDLPEEESVRFIVWCQVCYLHHDAHISRNGEYMISSYWAGCVEALLRGKRNLWRVPNSLGPIMVDKKDIREK